MFLSEFQSTGRALAQSGLITAASGNLSIRLKDKLIITSHGSLLSALTPEELVETGIYKDDNATPRASWELPVHRAIYKQTPALAIVHAHPCCAVTLTLPDDPRLPGYVAVVGESKGIVPGVLADEIAVELKKRPLVMVKGHGSFAAGRTLDEALQLSLKFEADCARYCDEHSIPVIQIAE